MVIIVTVFLIVLQIAGAESNNESDKLKNVSSVVVDNPNTKESVQELKDIPEEAPSNTPIVIEAAVTPGPTAENKIIFSFRAGEDNNSLSVESSYIDLGADLRTENGSVAALTNIAFPIVGPFWIDLETGLDSALPNTLFVAETGGKLKFGDIVFGADASFGPSFKFSGGKLFCTIRNAFYVVDKEVKDLFAAKKITTEEFGNLSILKSFGLSYARASLEYDDPTLMDSAQFGFDKIKFEITTQWKIDLFLIALEAGFNLDFSNYRVAQGIGITTKNFNLITMFKTLSSEKGIVIPPQVSVAIDYTVPLDFLKQKTAEAQK